MRAIRGRNPILKVDEAERWHPHLHYGCSLTSLSSQGQTAECVLIHVETEEAPELVNSRIAFCRRRARAQFDVADVYERCGGAGPGAKPGHAAPNSDPTIGKIRQRRPQHVVGVLETLFEFTGRAFPK